jgi:hypothetical protein
MRSKQQSESGAIKTHATKHLVIPVFFNEPPDLTGWCEGQAGVGRVIGVKSVLYSDGSAKRWYRMAAVKKKLSNTRKNFKKRVSKK